MRLRVRDSASFFGCRSCALRPEHRARGGYFWREAAAMVDRDVVEVAEIRRVQFGQGKVNSLKGPKQRTMM
jgi:hypothetical protein